MTLSEQERRMAMQRDQALYSALEIGGGRVCVCVCVSVCLSVCLPVHLQGESVASKAKHVVVGLQEGEIGLTT